jgi:hypothetical protein
MRETLAASALAIVMVSPGRAVEGAPPIVGRGPRNRYGGE